MTTIIENNTSELEGLHEHRQFVINKLCSILRAEKNANQTMKSSIQQIAEKIEQGIHDFTCDDAEEKTIPLEWSVPFTQLYCNKAICICTNLDPDSYVHNPRFRLRVLQGEFSPEKIAYLLPQEVFPEKWKSLLDEKFKIDKHLYETRTEAATDMYKCGKCQKRICTYFQLQTRSADEPMTTFVTCINCGNRWKH